MCFIEMKGQEFVCDFEKCGKRFNKKSRLESHKQSHSVSKPFACEFEGCGASYAWRHHLKRHITKIHSHPEQEFKCSVEMCMATFDTEFALRQHTRRSHQPAKNIFLCSFCNLTFDLEWQLQEHEASHTKMMPFKCDTCSEGFESFNMFKKHQRTHKSSNSQNRQYSCQECSEVFQTPKSLKKHREVHRRNLIMHKQDLTCDECNQVFRRKGHLLEHKSSAHTGNPEFRCRLGECDRVYYHKRNLLHHVRQVHEGKSFSCTKCDRKLSTKQKLMLHLKRHKEIPVPKKPPKKKSVKEKLLKQLVGNSDSSIDIDVVVKRKPEVKNPHISYVFAAKQQFPSLKTEAEGTENLIANRENVAKVGNVQG